MLNHAAKLANFTGVDAGLTALSFQPEALSHAEWWVKLLQTHWGADKQSVLSCKVNRVYFKPENQSYRIYLKIKVGDENGRYLGDQILFAHCLPRHDLHAQWEQTQTRRWTQPEFGHPVSLIPDANMIIWAYPNDPRLPGLALLADMPTLLQTLQANPAAFGLSPQNPPVAIKQATLTKYVASQRCGYIYEISLANGRSHHLYAKAYRASSGAAAAAAWQQVWNSPARHNGQLTLPEPYSYDADNHILWQEVQSGRPLAKQLGNVNLPALAANAGSQLGALHSLALDVPPGTTLTQETEELAKSLTAVSRTFPLIANRCQRLYEQLLSNRETLMAAPLVPIHASFKPSHLLVENGRCSLIDFDGTTLGDAAYDLGRFIAHLRGAEAKGKLETAVVTQAIDRFITSYNQAATHPVSLARIHWFSASLILSSHINKLVKRMYKAFDRFDEEEVNRLLTLAEQTLQRGAAHAH